MKYSDLVVEIKKLNIPSVYYQWLPGEVPALPYIVHLKTDRDDYGADNINYSKTQGVAVELYSRTPDFENEEKIEAMLTGCGIYYHANEAIIIDEANMYLKRYDFYLPKGN